MVFEIAPDKYEDFVKDSKKGSAKESLDRIERLKDKAGIRGGIMKTLELYVIRNKDTGKYVYEDMCYSLLGGNIKIEETDNLHFIANNYRYWCDTLEKAENRKIRFEENYKLNLKVVKIKQYTEYKECEL